MKRVCLFVGLVFFVLAFSACSSKKSVFLLLPDEDGHVGSFVVSNDAGSVVVDKAGEATRVESKSTVPGIPEVMPEAEIEKDFGEALAAQPMPPVTFILYFKFNGASLTNESKKLLPLIFEAVKERHSTDISVSGHSDRTGSDEYNIKISSERAQSITDLLVSGGVKAECVETSSHGEGNPLIDTGDNVPEPKNRRVEVTVR